MAPLESYSEGAHFVFAPTFDDASLAFTNLVSSLGPPRNRPVVYKFIKKLEDVLDIVLPPSLPRKATRLLSKEGLIDQFTTLWPYH